MTGVGRASPASAGASTRSTARRSASSASSRTPGGSGSTGCSPGVAHVRRLAGLARHDAAARRRRQHRVDLAGRFAEFVARLDGGDRPAHRHPAAGRLADALTDGVASLTQVDRADAVAGRPGPARARPGRGRRRRRAATPRCGCPTSGRCSATTSPGRPTRANFRTGTPHRLHDGADAVGAAPGRLPARPRRRRLPPGGVVDGDDVLARDPLTGERDPRSEDRQLLLDAIVAATETLVVTYTGADEHTGQPRPPAVPLGELLDALDRTTAGAGPRPDRGRPPAAAVRPPQRRRPAGSASRRRSPSTGRCWPPRGRAGAAAGPAAVPPSRCPPLTRRLPTTTSRWPTSSTSSATRSRASSAALDLTLPWDVDERRRRDAGRDRPAGDVGRRRPDARRHARAASTPTRRATPSGAAARCRPASSAGARPRRSREPAMASRSPR